MIHALKGQYQLPVYFLLVINYQTPDWVRYSISSFQTTGWMEKKSYILLGHQVPLPLRKCLHLFGEMMFHFLLAADNIDILQHCSRLISSTSQCAKGNKYNSCQNLLLQSLFNTRTHEGNRINII